MILRNLFAAGTLVLIGCTSDETSDVPVSVVVVDDSSGRIVSPMAGPSPDGTRVVYAQVVGGRSAIFVSDLDGSNAVRLSHGVWDSEPVWSPDSKWIAYQGEDPSFDVFVVPSDGSAPPRNIVPGPEFDTPYGWLNDGSGVIFNRTSARLPLGASSGDARPMVALLDGGPVRRIGPVMPGDLHAAWSPDGAYLAFDLHRGGANTVWVQDSTAGSTPRQLTTEGFENLPSSSMWSPDGKQVAYTSRRTGTQDIWIMDVASGTARQLTTDIRDDESPRWSPDGRWVAFISDRGGQRDLWMMPSAGGNAIRLTNDVAVESNPRWTPDGKSVFYTSTATAIELQLVPIAGGQARTLGAWDEYSILSARLSPDGQTVIFDTDRVGNGEIFTMAVAGGEPMPFAPSPRRDFAARYSPDGSEVAFLSDRGGTIDIWVAPAAGGEARNLTSTSGEEGEATWSPDGKQIAFVSSRDDGSSDLWLMPLPTGEAKRLTHQNLRPTWVQWSPDGKFIHFVGRRLEGEVGSDYYRIAATGGQPESLGAKPMIANAFLSRDGSRAVYAAQERGWSFLHIIPAGGGVSTPVSSDTSNVYQLGAGWSLGDSLLVVIALDLASNRDAADLWTYRLADGRWNQITRTTFGFEWIHGFTPDARDVLAVMISDRSQIRRVSVETLVALPP